MQACAHQAVSLHPDGSYPIDRQKCRLNFVEPLNKGEPLSKTEPLCGQCVKACQTQALRFAGTAYEIDELCQKLLKDAVFYKNSNGGVTFSGGEPMLHMNYLSSLARKLKENGIHLCLETCGFYNNERFEKELLPFLDLVYFDIKLFDMDTHIKYCGVHNVIILRNFETLFGKNTVKVLPRIPLVPGITTERKNLIAIRDFFLQCGVKEIGLLPYNPLWLSKLSSIGAAADYACAEWMTSSEKDEVKEVFKDFSFRNF